MKRLTVKRHLIILFMIWTTVRWNKETVYKLFAYILRLWRCAAASVWLKLAVKSSSPPHLKEMPWHFFIYFFCHCCFIFYFIFYFIRTIDWKGKKHFVHKVSDNIQSKKMCTSTKYCSWLLKHVQHSKNTDMDVDILQNHLRALLCVTDYQGSFTMSCGADVLLQSFHGTTIATII